MMAPKPASFVPPSRKPCAAVAYTSISSDTLYDRLNFGVILCSLACETRGTSGGPPKKGKTFCEFASIVD